VSIEHDQEAVTLSDHQSLRFLVPSTCFRLKLFEVLTGEAYIREVLDIGGRSRKPEDSGGDAYLRQNL
jgi:hypothetical protein